jgi:adenylosuccinate synthase
MPAIVVVGLGYGDEGKGAVVDHLVRQHKANGVVFFNGGAQRAHNVLLPDGSHHTFSQFSSGTFAGAMTYHAKTSVVNPYALFQEAEVLQEVLPAFPSLWNRIAVQKGALITTPFHVALNRIREVVRGQNRHGSCGMGVGETVLDAKNGFALRVEDLHDPDTLYVKLHDTQTRLRREAYKILAAADPPLWLTGAEGETLRSFQAIKDAMWVYKVFAKAVPMFDQFEFEPDDTYIFEGGQGALLHEYHGFHPYTTWSDTSAYEALVILGDRGPLFEEGGVKIVGVMRSYMTRHGAGPFVTEDPALAERFPEAHNGHGKWQGAWRVGWTDLPALRYGIVVSEGVDELAVTHLDRVQGDWKICRGYGFDLELLKRNITRQDWEAKKATTLAALESAQPEYVEDSNIDADIFLEMIEAELGAPVTIQGWGPTHEDYRVSVLLSA